MGASIEQASGRQEKQSSDPVRWSDVAVSGSLLCLPKGPVCAQVVVDRLLELSRKLKEVRALEALYPSLYGPVVAKEGYQVVAPLTGHTDCVNVVRWVSPGEFLSASDDNTLRLWAESASGSWSSVVLAGHTSGVTEVQFHPDGRALSGSRDRMLRVWSRKAEGEWSSEELKGHTDWVRFGQFHPDGRVLSGSVDGTLRLWTRGVDGKWSAEVLKAPMGQVVSGSVSTDGRIVCGGDDGSLYVWDGTLRGVS
jgi:WD40 repeat protein